ncbi:MAG TPA: hypothetical protein VF546_22210 [Pyrinomonadaceae bacterium]|jgi:hypothetical protein
MKAHASLTRALAPSLALALCAPCLAQAPAAPPAQAPTPARTLTQPAARPARPAPPPAQTVNASAAAAAQAARPQPAPAVTFDTLLAADSYAVYGELRGVGTYVNSKAVTELVAPLGLPSTGAPPEVLDLYNFLKAHAEELATARVLFAASPVRPKLPDGLAAVELSSPEQALKFETELRQFLDAHADVIRGSATSTTDTPGPPSSTPPAPRGARRGNRAAGKKPAAPYHLRRAGTLLVMSNAPFSLAALSPTEAPLLADEPGFQAARARFPQETLFVYFNTKRMNRYGELQREKYEREAKRQEAERRRAERRARARNGRAAAPDDESKTDADIPVIPTDDTHSDEAGPVPPPGVVGNTAPENPPVVVTTSEPPGKLQGVPNAEPTPTPEPQKELTPEERERQRTQEAAQRFLTTLPSIVFGNLGGGAQWPETIAVAAELADEDLVVRALVVKEPGDENRPPRPIPFVPLLLSGPALTTEAANVVPADTDVLLSASLDLPQMYDYVASMLKLLDLGADGTGARKEGDESFEGQLGAFEKASGFRLKDDLIAALGNEIAVAVPGRFLGARRGGAWRGAQARTGLNGPVFLIALNDKRGLQALLPRVLASAGLKGINEQQLIERRGDVELLAFTGGAVAFIERFLVIAPDAETMRRVADAYNERRTLANSDAFRDAGRWQPRQVLGQIYVANDLIKGLFDDPRVALEDVEDAQVREVLLRVNTDPGSVSYALTKDDQGLLHELHVPQNVLTLMSADALISQQLGPLRSHEAQAQYTLRELAQREIAYREKHGRYGSLEDLIHAEQGQGKDAADAGDAGATLVGFPTGAEGYDLKLNASGDKFEATATPTVYRKTGRRSFYINQENVLRGADTNGKPADATTPEVD